MKIIYEVVSVAGRVRSENQDNFYLNGKIKRMTEAECRMSEISEAEHQVFAVCDGMGGEDSGEIAAAIAVEVLQKYIPKQPRLNWTDYIKKVNTKICEYQEEYCVSMGTTFAGVYIDQAGLTAVNVGDSRIYQIHEGKIRQLSKDHNEYQSILDSGIEADERVLRRAKSRLTQFLGLPEDEMRLDPHIVNIAEVVPGDYYLICSDGLYGVLSDEQIAGMISDHKIEDGNICEALAKEAEKQGSKDNITGLLIFISENERTLSKLEFLKEVLSEASMEVSENDGLRAFADCDDDTLEIPADKFKKIPEEKLKRIPSEEIAAAPEEKTGSANVFSKLKELIQKHF